MKADGGEADTFTGAPRWAARIRRKGGGILGAGILLDAHHVLTCAHVVSRRGAYVAEFMGGGASTVTTIDATVEPDAYVPEQRDADGDPSGDIALLTLAEGRPVDEAVPLHRLSVPDRKVQIYGYPEGYNGGIRLPATLLGGVGRDGQVQLRAERPGDMARPGCSGGGVMDAATGRVIGMLLNGDTRRTASGYSFMSPAETIVRHLPQVARWTQGRSAVDADLQAGSSGTNGDGTAPSPFDHAFAERLARWLGNDGYPVKISHVAADDLVRNETLRRAITLADRELGSSSRGGSSSADPPGTVPRAGGHDLAVLAAGRTVEEIADRISERTGLLNGERLSATERIKAGGRRLTLVVAGADESAEPDRLLDLLDVMREHGSRLLLVFRHQGALWERARHELLVQPARESYRRILRLLAEATGERAEAFEGLRRGVAGDVGDVLRSLEQANRAHGFLPDSLPGTERLLDLVPVLPEYERLALRTLALLEAAVEQLGPLLIRRRELEGRLTAYVQILQSTPHGARDELRHGSRGEGLFVAARDLLAARPCDVEAANAAVERFVEYVENGPDPDGGARDD